MQEILGPVMVPPPFLHFCSYFFIYKIFRRFVFELIFPTDFDIFFIGLGYLSPPFYVVVNFLT